jgi:hypothetical protein
LRGDLTPPIAPNPSVTHASQQCRRGFCSLAPTGTTSRLLSAEGSHGDDGGVSAGIDHRTLSTWVTWPRRRPQGKDHRTSETDGPRSTERCGRRPLYGWPGRRAGAASTALGFRKGSGGVPTRALADAGLPATESVLAEPHQRLARPPALTNGRVSTAQRHACGPGRSER